LLRRNECLNSTPLTFAASNLTQLSAPVAATHKEQKKEQRKERLDTIEENRSTQKTYSH
jgi:hypothetical protein